MSLFNNFNDGWLVAKKNEMKSPSSRFVALSPQDVTINPINLRNNVDMAPSNELATPYPKQSSSLGVFYSLDGLSGKVNNIENETGGAVQRPMSYQKLETPYKGISKNLLESSSNQKPVQKTNISLNDSRKLGINTYTRNLSPVQASLCQDLFTAKDEIIEQKDVIMQKQKQIIIQLRRTNMELEDLLIQKQKEIVSQTSNERFALHLQEYQYQVQQLKQQIIEAKSYKQREVEKLQQKLGEREYENGKLEIALKEMEINATKGSTKVKQDLDTKVHELTAEQQRSQQLLADLKMARQENDKLQEYLEDLPTIEEFRNLQSQVKKTQIKQTENDDKYSHLQKRYKEKKSDYNVLEGKNKRLQEENNDLQKEFDRVSAILEKYRTREKFGPVLIEEYEDMKTKLTEIENEKINLKESLEKRHKKMKVLHYELLTKQKEYEEEKHKQCEIIQSLKDELQAKSVSVTQLNARCQELLDNSLNLQVELKKYKGIYTKDYQIKLKGLFTEILHCNTDVKSFLSLCLTRLKGKEPSLDALLGLRESPDKIHEALPGTTEDVDTDTIDDNLEVVTSIRSDIEQLRRVVSEQYAQELGDNMCVTQ